MDEVVDDLVDEVEDKVVDRNAEDDHVVVPMEVDVPFLMVQFVVLGAEVRLSSPSGARKRKPALSFIL